MKLNFKKPKPIYNDRINLREIHRSLRQHIVSPTRFFNEQCLYLDTKSPPESIPQLLVRIPFVLKKKKKIKQVNKNRMKIILYSLEKGIYVKLMLGC